jgi:hypothetical protein
MTSPNAPNEMAAAKEAEQVIEKERLPQLSRQDAELLASLLGNPPAPDAAMQAARYPGLSYMPATVVHAAAGPPGRAS